MTASERERVELWDAINAVVVASGGNAGNTSVARQNAVVQVERAVAALILRERAAAFEAAKAVCTSAERLALRDRSSESARTALDCASAIDALAAQERAR